MAADPSIPMDRATLRLVISDQRRLSRALLYPWVRVLSRVAVTIIVTAKRICPVRFAAHATMDRMCLWFLRRFVSPAAVSLLIRHFLVETSLLNFCVGNAGLPGGAAVGLRPVTLSELGNRAVIEHDLNVYRVLADLGRACRSSARAVTRAVTRRPPATLISACSTIPDVDPEPGTRRLLNLDIQTALCLMNIPFAFCLTPGEYRRAVHSLRLDASLLSVLAALTGDDTFLGWRTALPPVRVDSNIDVPATVYEHALICEYALARLGQHPGRGRVRKRTEGPMTAEVIQCSLVIVTVTGASAGAKRSSSEPLWRALAVFRFASVGYAALRLGVVDRAEYARPDWAWAVIAVMTAWTIATTIGYTRRKTALPAAGRRPRGHRRPDAELDAAAVPGRHRARGAAGDGDLDGGAGPGLGHPLRQAGRRGRGTDRGLLRLHVAASGAAHRRAQRRGAAAARRLDRRPSWPGWRPR